MTRILTSNEDSIATAAAALRAGQIVALPTETVYGLAGNATDGAAVARIYAAKGRPAFNPLIVHVANTTDARRLVQMNPAAETLAAAFWPGPLTMVLPLDAASPIASLVTAGLPTLAIRVPAHPVMRAVIAAAGMPLAAPSANRSGAISPTRAAHVAQSLGDRVDLILDGGASGHGLESTIVAPDANRLRLLRPGPITAEALEATTGLPVEVDAGGGIEAPGQLASHYAPTKPLRLDATAPRPGEWLIGFDAIPGDVTLSASGDLLEAAARLFDLLHQADATAATGIAVAPIPAEGLGQAIRDRIKRAAS